MGTSYDQGMDEETSRNGEIAGTADPSAAWPEGWVQIGYTAEGFATIADEGKAVSIDPAAFSSARSATVVIGPGWLYCKTPDTAPEPTPGERHFWGSVGDGSARVLSGGVSMEVDVAVNDDDQIRISAWAEGAAAEGMEIEFTPEVAAKIRDWLDEAIREGRWLS